MTEPVLVPHDDLRRVVDADHRLMAAISGLTDDDMRRPSLLADWTVGHVLTHVARNADSHTRRAEAAQRAEMVDQYVGGFEGRAADIERGAFRNSVEIIDDLGTSAEAMHAAWSHATDDAWAIVSRDVSGTERAMSTLPSRRWQELEVHIIDLGIGATHRDWPDEFVDIWLPTLRAGRDKRLLDGAQPPEVGALDARDELAWLYCRLQRPDLPELRSWG